MAKDDIYYVRVNLSTHDREHGFGLWYKENVAQTDDRSGRALATAWLAACQTPLLALLALDSRFESLFVDRRIPGPGVPGKSISTAGGGTVSGDALAILDAVVVTLEQSEYDPKRNGRIYISGVSEADVDAGKITSTFKTGALTTFVNAIRASISAASPDPGVWDLQVLTNRAPAIPGPIGDPVPVTGHIIRDIVYRQKRRRTKTRGMSD